MLAKTLDIGPMYLRNYDQSSPNYSLQPTARPLAAAELWPLGPFFLAQAMMPGKSGGIRGLSYYPACCRGTVQRRWSLEGLRGEQDSRPRGKPSRARCAAVFGGNLGSAGIQDG
jgi:hypothetical protein